MNFRLAFTSEDNNNKKKVLYSHFTEAYEVPGLSTQQYVRKSASHRQE